jgi:Na+-translocating ferredoxin:NAD+ oxidoreductase RnfE subunit
MPSILGGVTKKLFFEKQKNEKIKSDKYKPTGFFISLIVVSLICLIVGSFELIPFENPIINRRISAIGFASQALFSLELSV